MAINGDYSVPVLVNGYPCRNCSEVSAAQKHIDPAHPKSGAFGADAASDPTATPAARKAASIARAQRAAAEPAGYGLTGLAAPVQTPGRLIDIDA